MPKCPGSIDICAPIYSVSCPKWIRGGHIHCDIVVVVAGDDDVRWLCAQADQTEHIVHHTHTLSHAALFFLGDNWNT